ncbi:hypothetical protein HOD08_02310 [bacterium]|jgi:hypothetical protein|nr:hypothetical protein [bacterium]
MSFNKKITVFLVGIFSLYPIFEIRTGNAQGGSMKPPLPHIKQPPIYPKKQCNSEHEQKLVDECEKLMINIAIIFFNNQTLINGFLFERYSLNKGVNNLMNPIERPRTIELYAHLFWLAELVVKKGTENFPKNLFWKIFVAYTENLSRRLPETPDGLGLCSDLISASLASVASDEVSLKFHKKSQDLMELNKQLNRLSKIFIEIKQQPHTPEQQPKERKQRPKERKQRLREIEQQIREAKQLATNINRLKLTLADMDKRMERTMSYVKNIT